MATSPRRGRDENSRGGLGWLCDAYRKGKQITRAQETVAEEVKLLRALAGNDATNPIRIELVRAMVKWGEVLADEGKSTTALIVALQGLDQLQVLSSADPNNALVKVERAETMEHLAGLYARFGQVEPAGTAAREAVEIRNDLAQHTTDTKALRRDRAESMIRLGDTFASTLQFPPARKWYKSALEVASQDPNDPLGAAAAAQAKEKIAVLDAIEALKDDPFKKLDNIDPKLRVPVLRTAVDWHLKTGKLHDTAALAGKLSDAATSGEDRYHAAQALARCGYTVEALKALQRAVDAEFEDVHLLKAPPWDSYQKDETFQKILKKLEEKQPAPK